MKGGKFFQGSPRIWKIYKVPLCKHEISCYEETQKIEERMKEVMKEIDDMFEDDLEEKVEFLILMNNINFLKTDVEKEKELDRIVNLLAI